MQVSFRNYSTTEFSLRKNKRCCSIPLPCINSLQAWNAINKEGTLNYIYIYTPPTHIYIYIAPKFVYMYIHLHTSNIKILNVNNVLFLDIRPQYYSSTKLVITPICCSRTFPLSSRYIQYNNFNEPPKFLY
jgi:hypothetical protein